MTDTLLIVEDEFLIALAAQVNLEEAGYHVCGIASSEAGAIDLARRYKPGFALVDLTLRPGNGANVARFLKEEIGTGVFLVSADIDLKDVANGVGVLCASKPFDSGLLPTAFDFVKKHQEGEEITDAPSWLHHCQV